MNLTKERTALKCKVFHCFNTKRINIRIVPRVREAYCEFTLDPDSISTLPQSRKDDALQMAQLSIESSQAAVAACFFSTAQ